MPDVITWPSAPDFFVFCPKCAAPRAEGKGGSPFQCQACGFTYYFNTASAVAVFIENEEGKCLFIRRGREPAKGRLAMAGGFTDPMETGEEAIRREIREELGLELGPLTYVGTWPNQYLAGGFIVHVLDIFYRATLVSADLTLDAEEVSGVEWLNPKEINLSEMAFPSMQQALARYLEILPKGVG